MSGHASALAQGTANIKPVKGTMSAASPDLNVLTKGRRGKPTVKAFK